MRFEAADGGPTLFAYLIISSVAVGIAVFVLLLTRHLERRAMTRQIRRNSAMIAEVREDQEELKGVVYDFRGRLLGDDGGQLMRKLMTSAPRLRLMRRDHPDAG